jgi:hypothetical protein
MVSIFVGRILTVNERAYVASDQISQAQQNLRAIGDLLERDLRHAGLMVPDMVALCGIDNANGPDALYVSDAMAIDPQDDFTTYGGVAITGGSATNLNGPFWIDLASLTVEAATPARAAYDTDSNGTNDSDFRVGGGVIITDSTNPEDGVACGEVRAVDIGGSRINVYVRQTLSNTTSLIAVPAHEYRIDTGRLLWNNKVLADGIEDFQVTYIIDNDGNNQVIADEIFGDDETGGHDLFKTDTPDPGPGSSYALNAAGAAASVREVRVNLIARTRLEDETYTQGRAQGTENRDVSGVTADGFRRRRITTKVMLRNVGIQI